MSDTTSTVKLPPLPASEEGTSDEEEVPKVYSDEVLDMTNLAAEVCPIVCNTRVGHTLTLPYPPLPYPHPLPMTGSRLCRHYRQ